MIKQLTFQTLASKQIIDITEKTVSAFMQIFVIVVCVKIYASGIGKNKTALSASKKHNAVFA